MKLPIVKTFQIIPEGMHVFRIESVDYDADFGTLKVNMVTAKGQKMTERFQMKDANDEPNERAMNAWSFFAQTAMNDFNLDELDPDDLVGHYIEAEVIHTSRPNRNDPSKTVSFANLGREKHPASGFAGEAPAKAPEPAGADDLDALLD